MGDPACWLANVCPECGAFVEDPAETAACPRCGAPLPGAEEPSAPGGGLSGRPDGEALEEGAHDE
jgi:predicted amidophosphoribosyltransferase